MNRRVIRIAATDSPNVALGLRQKAKGLVPTDEVLVPGVITYSEYVRRDKLWDEVRKCVGLRACFYTGARSLLFPPDWLDRAETAAVMSPRRRFARAIGVDTAQGGDNTAVCGVDEEGVVFLRSLKTPDTDVIVGVVKAAMLEYGVPSWRVCFDAGGGGKQHVDRMRAAGDMVRVVSFGGAVTGELKRAQKTMPERRALQEDRFMYVNRRAQMYGELSLRLDPHYNEVPFGIPARLMGDPGDLNSELRHQLAPIPRTYDEKGRLKLLPKSRQGSDESAKEQNSLIGLIGHSPDEADALVLAYHVLLHKGPGGGFVAGGF